MNPIHLCIVVRFGGRELASALTVAPDTPVADLVARVLREHGLPGGAADWVVTRDGEPVPLAATAGDLVPQAGRTVVLHLQAVPPAGPPDVTYSAPAPAPRPSTASPPPAGATWGAPRPRARSTSDDLPAPKWKAAPVVTRRATVRYYYRMAPGRLFPLLVVLSAESIREAAKKAVRQAESDGFRVEAGSRLEVEPVLPGCDCYPPRETIAADPEPVTATFYVVPRVLGRVPGARVLLRQDGRVLAEVALDIRVAKPTAAVALGLLGLVAPYLTMGLKHLKLDFESQRQDGFPLYRMAGEWAADHLRPEWLGFGLLVLAAACYLWVRPRRRDVFWDVEPHPVAPGRVE